MKKVSIKESDLKKIIHESFIDKARRQMSFGRLPIVLATQECFEDSNHVNI